MSGAWVKIGTVMWLCLPAGYQNYVSCIEPKIGYTYVGLPLTQARLHEYQDRKRQENMKQAACLKAHGQWMFGHLPGSPASGNWCYQ